MGTVSRRTEGRHGEHQWADLRLAHSGNRRGESYAIVHSDITEITQPSHSEKGESREGLMNVAWGRGGEVPGCHQSWKQDSGSRGKEKRDSRNPTKVLVLNAVTKT